ncbi:hypothetical protein DPEC_G00048780 [Dallia pectoralis]|uniref:Uncharacterized protein n=1 Tax=Dallia pectoralis TaxID=75939 RepID=A0ACC2HAH1_DALPE|nr:hypothetical protein DPEC_G00048780 [Dallia pectoralis]
MSEFELIWRTQNIKLQFQTALTQNIVSLISISAPIQYSSVYMTGGVYLSDWSVTAETPQIILSPPAHLNVRLNS